MSPCQFRIGLAATLLLTTAAAGRAEPPAVDVPGLIDKLTDVAESDDDISWDLFLPLVRGRAWAGGMLHQKQVPSDALRALAKQGAAAVPLLLDHLDDKRPTKLVITRPWAGMFSSGGILSRDELCDDNIRTTRTNPNSKLPGDGGLFEAPDDCHAVTVGDLCFAALGQIVNRHYRPEIILVGQEFRIISPTDWPALGEAVRKEWAGLTPERHRAALVEDFLKPDTDKRRIGACQRLAYYYPDALDPLALTFLARPTFDWYDVERFVQDRLYAAGGAKEQHKLFDDYLAMHGEVARDGIRLQLYKDLQDFNFKYAERAGRLLVELFGKPKGFKSDDVRIEERMDPLSSYDKARVIEEGLIYDDSPKIDAAVRDLLAGIDDNDDLAEACMARLVGRGFDEDIARYRRRRIPLVATDENKRRLQVWLDRAGWTRLHVAVEGGTMDEILRRIAERAGVNAPAKDGRTPLHLAAAAGDLEIVQALIDAKADLNPRDATGTTPVELAAREDNEEIVLQLADRGCELPDVLSAAIAGKTEVVESLLKKDPQQITVVNVHEATALHLAARRGDVKTAAALLAAGAAVNARDRDDLTPLYVAIDRAHDDVVALLLEHRADINAVNKLGEGTTPLLIAVATGNRRVVEWLLDRGADPNPGRADEGGWPLKLTTTKDLPDIAGLLLDKGANPNLRDVEGWTPLHLAAQAGREDVARVLLDHKADLKAKGKEGRTPLHEAAAAGKRKVMELLIDRNADVNAKDEYGETPLHLAAQENYPEVFALLLENGADVDARDRYLQRPLHMAAQDGDWTAVRILLEHHATVDVRDDNGRTPLHRAAGREDADAAEELLAHRANINALDGDGLTPLHLAVESDSVAVVRMLLAHNANPTVENGKGLTPLEMLVADGARGEHAAEIKRLLEQASPKK